MSIIRKGSILRSITILIGLMIGGVFLVSPPAYAANGSGTNTVTPTSTNVSSTGNTFTFTFTAAETMDSGGISITSPTGWSAAQGTNGSAGYTTVSTTGMVATVENNADSLTVPAAWTKSKCGGLALSTTMKHEGTGSVLCSNFNSAVSNSWYIKPATAENWSGYTRVGFWINPSKNIPANALTFSFDNANNLGSPIENIALPAIASSTWTYVTADFALATSTRTSVASYGWRSAANTFNGSNIYIDDLLIGPGMPTFPTAGVVDVRILKLANAQTITTTYGSGGGASGVTAPATAGTTNATTTSRFDDSGILTYVASQPTLTAKYPTPTLTSISPTFATVNASGFTMNATGTNFITGKTVLQFNGSARATTVDSATALHATISASDLTTVGTFNITVSNPTPGGGTSTTQTFTVNKATTTIAMSSSAVTSTYGNTITFTATTTPVSGGPATGTVTFKSGATILGTGTLTNNVATFSTSSLNVAGSPYSITAVYGGDSTFLGSTSSAITQTITKKALTVTGMTASNKIYDATTTVTLSGGVLVGVVGSDVVSIGTRAGVFVDKNVGTGKIVTVTGVALSGADAVNYSASTDATTSASVTAKTLTVTGMTGVDKVYDATTTASVIGGALSGVIAGDIVTLNTASTSASFADKNVGTNKIVTVTGVALSGADASNYTVTNPTGITANITTKGLTVTGITANDKNYDGNQTATLNVGGAVLNGVISGDNAALNTSGAVGSFDTPNAGLNKLVTISGLTITGVDAANYLLAQPTTTASITNPAPSITIFSPTFASAGGSDFTLTINGSNFIASTTATFNGSPKMVTLVNANQITIPILAADIATDGTSTITVTNPAPGGGMATSTNFAVIVRATKLVISGAPYSGTVDAPITITIQAQKPAGGVDTTFNNTVTLVLNSSTTYATSSQDHTVTITNGVGTYALTDHIMEPVHLSLLDTASTSLDVTSTGTAIFDAGAVTKFLFGSVTDTPQDIRLRIDVMRQDQYNNYVTSGSTNVYFYVSPTTTANNFYNALTGGTQTNMATIQGGATSSSIWFGGAPLGSLGTYTITASDNATSSDGTVGIADASATTTITPVATQLVIIDPTDGTVDAPITVNIEARDDNNNLVTSYNGSATLAVSGSATLSGGGTIIFADGRATTTVHDTIAPETATISIIASSTALRATSTQNVFIGVGALSQFALTDPGDAVAGTLIGYAATRKDQYGNLITAGTLAADLLVSPTSTPGLFYAANSTSSARLTTLQFDNGSATKQFWYYNEAVGSYQLTVQSGSAVGHDMIAIGPAAVAKLTMNDRASTNPGSRLEYTVVRKDRFNNLVTSGTLPVYMYADPTSSSTAFYDAATGGNVGNLVTIADTQSSANVWYYETQAGSYTITASDNATIPDGAVGLLDATDQVNVQIATATRFVFASVTPRSLAVGNASVVTIEARDDYGNLDTSYQNDVKLVTGVNSASGAGLVAGSAVIDIVNGIGSITLTDNIAETVSLALTDSQGTGLNVSDALSITWNPGPTAEFVLNDPGDMVAGNRIGYAVSRKDHYGNYVTAGSDTIYLYSDSLGIHKAFYTSSTTNSTAQFVTITAGATSTNFWYYDDAAGAYTITASDNATTPDGATGINDGIDQLIVVAAPIVATRYVILDPANVTVGQTSVVVIQTQDDAGALDKTRQGEVLLVFSTSSAVTIPGMVDKEVAVNINNGVGTVTVTDAANETIQLSLRLPTGSTSTLSVASTKTLSFVAVPSFVGGGGAGYIPPQPVAIFTGRAYPGAKVVLFARTAAGDIPVKQDIKVAADGTFTVDFSGALRGLEAFGLSILDENGRVAQTKIYDMNKVTAVTAEQNLYIAPTTGIVQRMVTLGNNVGITGSAAPGSMIKAEVDGQPVDARVKAGKDGTYRLLINTKDLSVGGHVVRTKQVDKNGVESGFSTSKVFMVSKTLNTRADLNNNGTIDIGDWSIFLTSFGSTNPDVRKQADLNGDGKVDISDFSIFIRSSVGR